MFGVPDNNMKPRQPLAATGGQVGPNGQSNPFQRPAFRPMNRNRQRQYQKQDQSQGQDQQQQVNPQIRNETFSPLLATGGAKPFVGNNPIDPNLNDHSYGPKLGIPDQPISQPISQSAPGQPGPHGEPNPGGIFANPAYNPQFNGVTWTATGPSGITPITGTYSAPPTNIPLNNPVGSPDNPQMTYGPIDFPLGEQDPRKNILRNIPLSRIL